MANFTISTLPLYVATDWSNGTVSVLTREAAARDLTLCGQPKPPWREATDSEIVAYERSQAEAEEASRA